MIIDPDIKNKEMFGILLNKSDFAKKNIVQLAYFYQILKKYQLIYFFSL